MSLVSRCFLRSRRLRRNVRKLAFVKIISVVFRANVLFVFLFDEKIGLVNKIDIGESGFSK